MNSNGSDAWLTPQEVEFLRRSVRELLCVYLREGPPVHVGAANVNVFLVYDPELCVEDT